MILSDSTIKYFRLLGSKVKQGMQAHHRKTPYFIEDDPVLRNYEMIRAVWLDSMPVHAACNQYALSRSAYYKVEACFVEQGLPGLFPAFSGIAQTPELEELVLLVKESRPSLQSTAILRIAQAVPVTSAAADMSLISSILHSHGQGRSNLETDKAFMTRIQRTLEELQSTRPSRVKARDKRHRKQSFFIDNDPAHNRLELLRELFYPSGVKLQELCVHYGVSKTSFYRLEKDYKLYGPWACIPGSSSGQKKIASELQLKVILEKLKTPTVSAQQLVERLKLRCSRFVVLRVIKRWGLGDKAREPVALDQYLGEAALAQEGVTAHTSAYHRYSDSELLATRRINRHFELICDKMKTHAFHICDPGPLLLAPFVNELGIVQAFESYGPARQRGQEITNLALLNVMRIIAGYRRISHLSSHRDRSVAFASGLGLFGSCSKFYEKTLDFKFDQIYKLRCDLVARAKELGLIEGLAIGFDFHFKEFYGRHSEEKQIGKGPDKSGDLVPGFRPHVAWDLATNALINIAYYQGGIRSPRIIRGFCEQNIFTVLDPSAIKEIYMDSEYTKEGDLDYFKQVKCKNGDVFICLKKNRQIKKLIEPALNESRGWEHHDTHDERKSIQVVLPNTKLPLTIVLLRDRETKGHIRCFGSTNTSLPSQDILKKYRYRWIIENGLKDLVYSYFADEIFGTDPEKIEFEFYCIMVARLAYEYFLKELGGEFLNKPDGNKCILSTMRNLLFERRNCTIEQDSSGNILLTFLDAGETALETRLLTLFSKLTKNERNKVLWWKNRGIVPQFRNQYSQDAPASI